MEKRLPSGRQAQSGISEKTEKKEIADQARNDKDCSHPESSPGRQA